MYQVPSTRSGSSLLGRWALIGSYLAGVLCVLWAPWLLARGWAFNRALDLARRVNPGLLLVVVLYTLLLLGLLAVVRRGRPMLLRGYVFAQLAGLLGGLLSVAGSDVRLAELAPAAVVCAVLSGHIGYPLISSALPRRT